MRRATGLTLLIAALAPGCNIAYYAGHNLVNEPGFACGQHSLRKRMRQQAAAAWDVERDRGPHCPRSAAYEDGFLDGYTDLMMEGGPAQAPAAPPPEYRRHAKSFTADGQAAQRDYLAGFRHGAEVAAASGGRACTLVTLALPVAAPDTPATIICGDPAGRGPTVEIPSVPPPPEPAGRLPDPKPKPQPEE